MKYSLCIEPVFKNVGFYDRIALAKEAGADAVEFWDPTAYDAKKIGAAAARAGIPVAACCLAEAWKIRLNFPFDAVKKNVERSISLGRDIGCSTFIGLSGDVECRADSQKTLLIENLKRTADLCERENVTIVVEALNSIYDHKGYYLDSSYVGFEIMKAVNSRHIKLLYDVYHMQLMEGNLINSVTTNIDFIGHFHSAGVPGRHEPANGEIFYPRIIKAAEDAGYDGYFGMEYWPEDKDEIRSVRNTIAYFNGK